MFFFFLFVVHTRETVSRDVPRVTAGTDHRRRRITNILLLFGPHLRKPVS